MWMWTKIENMRPSSELWESPGRPGPAVPDRELDLILNLLRHLNMSEISSWQINSPRTVTETYWLSFKALVLKSWECDRILRWRIVDWEPTPAKTKQGWGHPEGIHYVMRDSVLWQIRKEAVERRWKIDTRGHNHVLSCHKCHTPDIICLTGSASGLLSSLASPAR